MLAILGGLGAALCWATSSMASARASRAIGAWATLGWVMLIGTAMSIPATLLWGGGANLTGEALILLAISGAANVVGLLLAYAAFQRGQVAVVASILATEGATAAVISIAFGEQVAIGALIVLAALAVGVVLASSGGQDDGVAAEPGGLAADPHQPRTDAAVLPIALAAVACFGINLYATGRLGATLPLVWSILPARLGGAVFVALPLLATRRLTLVRPAVPFVVIVAVAEVVGMAVYAYGARDGIAVAAVTSSQFGAIAAVVSVVAFGERLRRRQVVGVALIALGVAALAAVRATA
ncbi:MAG TPA: DMT family transporter [Candidatus Limnocylindrales bacterium]|nr:DMT family transporter [Candidatus Limnocylindrales bacterium]